MNLKHMEDFIATLNSKFQSVWPEICEAVLSDYEHRDISKSNKWLEKVLQYNVPHGKGLRGMTAVFSYSYFADTVTEKDLKLACILGWVIEIMHASFLVTDDIMNKSETRRGRPCWYKVNNLGTAAVNDAFLLQNTAYFLLRKYFQNKEYFPELFCSVQDIVFKTTLGQTLDTQTSLKCCLSEYSKVRYSTFCKYKTSYYSFYLPVVCAMIMTRRNSPFCLPLVEETLLWIGEYFQVQDDYLDVFGDYEITGKIGTDIEKGKCTWLVFNALAKANTNQKLVLEKSYGKNDKQLAEFVKEIYRDLCLPEEFRYFEQ